jgi:hypothetical protein
VQTAIKVADGKRVPATGTLLITNGRKENMKKPWLYFVIIGILVVALAGSAWGQKGTGVDLKCLMESDFEKLQADTAEKKEKLKAMPQKQFFTATKQGKRLYLCADADTGALFVGDEACYKKYCDLATKRKLPAEQTKIQEDYGENFDWLMWQNKYIP